MTAQLLAADLSALIQESRRKNADIRSAAEKSLGDLKALPNTSEAQLAADLRRRPNFVRPFLLSCATRNPKYAGTAIVSLQRLVVSNGLAKETLKDVLDVLRDCSSLGLEIQLKILQALPSLLQNYALTGTLLAVALHTCFLLHGSKTAVVSNTAAATLQQAVVSVLGKVAQEDGSSVELEYVDEVPIDEGAVSIRSAALDAYQLLNDLCLMTEGYKPQSLHQTITISPEFGLELIEAMLSNHSDTVISHPEQIHILRIKLMPFLIRMLSEKVTFSTTVRVMRLLPIVFGSMLSVLATECEIILGLLNHALDPDAASLWKRVLCMEVWRGIHAESTLVRSMYAHFDQQQGKRNIVRDHLAIMVRLAAEKPSIIGLGQQSSVPTSSQSESELDEQAALQVEGISGTIGVAMSLRSSTAPGISAQWSNMRVPCIDQLDKNEPPAIPAAYLYSLALTCINSFSEGLARFLLPFSIPPEIRTKRKPRQVREDDEQQSSPTVDGDQSSSSSTKLRLSSSPSTSASKLPINPLTLEKHVLFSQIQTSADMIDNCWPALLAAYSTFLHAALDSEYYHALVRSFQKFSQVSGLLRLSTPRDAFLTTLGKNAVPPAIVTAYAVATSATASGERRDRKRTASGVQDGDGRLNISTGTTPNKARQSIELGTPSLNTRNLLCLRALLNLGIALGPVLQSAWSIVLETLQQADLVIAQRRSTQVGQATASGGSETEYLGDIGNEISAVNIAATRMFESCSDLPDEAFLDVLISLKGLLRDLHTDTVYTPLTPIALSSQPTNHQRTMSTAGAITGVSQDVRLNTFVIENMTKLVGYNSPRLLQKASEESGWNIVVDTLIDVLSAQDIDPDLRLKAAGSLSDLVGLTANSGIPEEHRDRVRYQGLAALMRQVESLYRRDTHENKTSRACELEIHWLSLEALRASLEQYGDSLAPGWEHVLAVLRSPFNQNFYPMGKSRSKESRDQDLAPSASTKSPKLVRSSFGSLQLICSDFLSCVPPVCLPVLLSTVHLFCAQLDDLNIALTSTTLFWNISEYLWQEDQNLSLGESYCLDEDIYYQSPNGQGSGQTTNADMWLRLLLILTDSTIDQRSEVRHSALHTLFRIFDASGNNLSPVDWIVCQRRVILKLLLRNEEAYQASRRSDSADRDLQTLGWNETAIILLEDISGIVRHYLPIIVTQAGFKEVWGALQSQLLHNLHRKSLSLSAAVYRALSNILAKAASENMDFRVYTELAWELWQSENPVEHSEVLVKHQVENQTALLAYLHCLTTIYRIAYSNMRHEDVTTILCQLQICATGSTATPYSGDIDTMTPVQLQILDCVRMIRADTTGIASALIKSISFFVTLAYEQNIKATGREGPTFIALSKATMDLLRDAVLTHILDKDIYLSGSLTKAMQSLLKPMQLKYKWDIEGKDPPPWKKATTTTVTILKVVAPTLQRLSIQDTDISPIWSVLVNCCDAIVSVDLKSDIGPARIRTDQDFDIEAFQELIALLVPVLGSNLVNDKLRDSFTDSIFRNSIIHAAHPDDLPQPGQELLESLRSTHIGRTQDLPPSLRSKMSYVLLNELFSLVAKHDGSSERVKLAQAAAPYLILRVGIVIKAYNLDQPLRGRMPQPLSQKQEMLYILRKLVELDCEPEAIPNAPGVVSKHKKHLFRVYGLVTNAMGVARRNEEMQIALTRVIEAISEDFGI